MVDITDRYVILIVVATFILLVLAPSLRPCTGQCSSVRTIGSGVWLIIGGPYLFALLKYFIKNILKKEPYEEIV